MKNMKRAIIALSFLVSSPALASETITNVQLASGGNYTVNVNGENVYDDALILTVNGKQILSLCDDIFHNISIGQSVVFNTIPFSAGITNFNGGFYNIEQVNSIDWLVKKSTNLFNTKGPALGLDLAALQLAVWTVGNPTSSFSNYNTDVFTKSKSYILQAESGIGGKVTQLYSTDGVQGQITAAVPEPSSWAMMLLGIGVIGYYMRFQSKTSLSCV